MSKQPTLEEIVDLIKNHDKRIGLRMLYQRFFIPHSERPKFKLLWDKLDKELKDAAEKEKKSAGYKLQERVSDGSDNDNDNSG